MAELECPHCGQMFSVDDTELSSIVSQIRDEEFSKDVERRVGELKKHLEEKHKLELDAVNSDIKLKLQESFDKKLNELRESFEKESRKLREDHDKETQKLREEVSKAELVNQKLASEIESAEDKKKVAVLEAVKEVRRETLRGTFRLRRKSPRFFWHRRMSRSSSTRI